jgi:hypothetical protein
MVSFKNEAIRVIQIDRYLAFPVLSQLMAPGTRNRSHDFQVLGSLEFSESLHYQPCLPRPPCALQSSFVIELFLQLVVFKDNIHEVSKLSILLTHWVNDSVNRVKASKRLSGGTVCRGTPIIFGRAAKFFVRKWAI